MKQEYLSWLSKKLFDFSCGVAGMQAYAALEELDGPLWHRVVATAAQAAARTETDALDDSSDHLISWYEDARKAMTEAHCLLKLIQKMGLLPRKKDAKKLLELAGELVYEVNAATRNMREEVERQREAAYNEMQEEIEKGMRDEV